MTMLETAEIVPRDITYLEINKIVCLQSHRRTQSAIEEGRFDKELTPIKTTKKYKIRLQEKYLIRK